MNTNELTAMLSDALLENEDLEGRVQTFQEAGFLTGDLGLALVVDGRRFTITVRER